MGKESKPIALFFFTKIKEEPDKNRWKCKCGTKRTQAPNKGYSNLSSHVEDAHPDWKEEMRSNLFVPGVSQKAKNVFKWIEWTVMDNLSFSFCESALTKSNVNPDSISTDTLVMYIDKLVGILEEKISTQLPENFWNYDGRMDAHGKNPRECVSPLLALAPLADQENFNAASHVDFIMSNLLFSKKNVSCVKLLVADNEPLNKRIAKDLGIQMIGCASHRLNLAVKEFLKPHEPTLEKIQKYMVKLSSLKLSGLLRKHTKLAPVQRNFTRWSSTYSMLQRYVELHTIFEKTLSEIYNYLLPDSDFQNCKSLLEDLEKFESVNKSLQKSTCNLSEARKLFDALIEQHDELKGHLSADASIIHRDFIKFENALVKLTNGDELRNVEKIRSVFSNETQ